MNEATTEVRLIPVGSAEAALEWVTTRSPGVMSHLRTLAGAWHPMLLPWTELRSQGDRIACRSQTFRRLWPSDADAPLGRVEQLRRAVELPPGRFQIVEGELGQARVAFLPGTSRSPAKELPRPATSADADPFPFVLLFRGRAQWRTRAAEMLHRVARGQALAMVFSGPSGSGRSTLLDVLAVDMAERGAEVRRGIPERLAVDVATVIVLDDLEGAGVGALGHAAELAAHTHAPVLVLASAAAGPVHEAHPALELEVGALGTLAEEDLLEALRPLLPVARVVEGELRCLARRSQGNPYAFRVLVERALRDAPEPERVPPPCIGECAPPATAVLPSLVRLAGPREQLEAQVERAEDLVRAGELRRAARALDGIDRARLEPPDPLANRLALVTALLLDRSGRVDEARQIFESVLERLETDERELRAETLVGLGHLLVRSPGGSRAGERFVAEAREIYRLLGRRDGIALALSREGEAALHRGDLEVALGRQLQALEHARAGGHSWLAADCHVEISAVSLALGDRTRAERHARSALECTEEGAAHRSRTRAHSYLAAIAVERGELDPGEDALLASHCAHEQAGDPRSAAIDLRFLGIAALARGLLELAEERLEGARQSFRELGDPMAEAACLHGLALVALDRGRPSEALLRAESGLRCLAPRPPERLALAIRLTAGWAILASAEPAGRPVHEVIAEAAAHADPALAAEAEALAAALAAHQGRDADALAGFERAVALAARCDGPDLLGRIIAHALRLVGNRMDARSARALVTRLREVVPEQALITRLERGVGGVAGVAGERLADDGLLRLEHTLTTSPPAGRLAAVFELLQSKVPYTRAALLSPDPDGLRVLTFARVRPPGAGQPDGFRLALILGGRARLTGTTTLVPCLRDDPVLGTDGETGSWRLAQALASPSRDGLVLFADRDDTLPPFTENELAFVRAVVERVALERRHNRAESPARPQVTKPLDDLGIAGVSAAIGAVRSHIASLADYEGPVFLTGPSGTGKELVARALFRTSRRRTGELVCLNSSALPETLLESELFGHVKGAFSGATADREGLLRRADGGVLFLDEVADLSLASQAKLLRVVELGEYRPLGSSHVERVDIRVLSATNKNMAREVKAGRFREDLFYRLMSAVTIELPPLVDRVGDIPVLVELFVGRLAARDGRLPLRFSSEVLGALERHPFRGNVRELEHLIAGLHARVGDRVVELNDLPRDMRDTGATAVAGTLEDALVRARRGYLRQVLELHQGNRTHAARTAGVSRQTLLRHLAREGILRHDASDEHEPGSVRSAAVD